MMSEGACLIPPFSRICLIPARSASESNWQILSRRTTILLITLQITQPSRRIAMAKEQIRQKYRDLGDKGVPKSR